MNDEVMSASADCILSRDIITLPSYCGGDSRLSIPAALDIFQDTATLHADRFDIGPEGMARRNYFWIITKTRIHVNRLPDMMETVRVSTWIQEAERASCERDYSITKGDEILAYGRSIWAVISRDTGRLVHMKGLYPEIDFNIAPPDDRPLARLSKQYEEAREIGRYNIRSVDIDLGGHMNNVNYVRAMLGCFSTEELHAMNIREIEMNFISQSYEGETLRFVLNDKNRGNGVLEIGALNHEGKAVYSALFVKD